ncbi:MAG: cadherin-like domain-containing protein, partial [Dongiaceae bacterium]
MDNTGQTLRFDDRGETGLGPDAGAGAEWTSALRIAQRTEPLPRVAGVVARSMPLASDATAAIAVAASGAVEAAGTVLLAADLAGATLKELAGKLYVFLPDGSTVIVQGSAIAGLLSRLRIAPELLAQSADGVVVLDVDANQAVDLTGSGFRHVQPGALDLPELVAAGVIDQTSLEYRSLDPAGEQHPAGEAAPAGTPGNNPPVAVADTGATGEGVPTTITVLANDTDVDGDPLTVTAAFAGNGSVTINPDGTITYTPNAGFAGTDTITYQISDGNGGTSSVSFTVFVNAIGNNPPVAVADSGATDEGLAITIDVLANDTDVDGDPLTVTAASALNGSVVINPDGTLGYTPNANFNGTDTIVYTISDGNGGTDTAVVTVTVNPVNDAPVANDDAASTDEDTPVTITVLANDTDVDGDPLTVSGASAGNGSVVINPDGTLGYTPNAEFNGTDTITYTISDGNGGTDTAVVTVTVNPVNDAPVANDDAASTDEDTPVTITVLANDTDVDGD